MLYFLIEKYETFCLHKYVNVLQLSIVDSAADLYVVCKYLIFILKEILDKSLRFLMSYDLDRVSV